MEETDFVIPEYCEYYKTFTVEEIYFNKFPHKQHYGKCAVIGFTSFSSQYFLENIKINFLPRSYCLPGGYCKILLLTALFDKPIPINKTCEIFGELVLIDNCGESLNPLPKTPKDVAADLYRLRTKTVEVNNVHCSNGIITEVEFNEHIKKLQDQFQPAIRVHTVNIVDQAERLIECNLAIRLMQKSQNNKID